MQNKKEKHHKETTMTRKHDLILICIEMSKQAQHVKHCWDGLRQIHRAQELYPDEFNLSYGFYRTAFDAFVTSIFIGLGKLYDKDDSVYSVYTLQTLLGYHRETHAEILGEKSKKLKALSPLVDNLRVRRHKQYAHNDQDVRWDFEELRRQSFLGDEGIEALIDFACEYCDFFTSFYLHNPWREKVPPCSDLENTLKRLNEARKDEEYS